MTEVNRRGFLATAVTSLGLAATARDRHVGVCAGRGVRPANRIDVHHHFAPPAWLAEVKGRPLLQPANTTWTPARRQLLQESRVRCGAGQH